MSKFEAKNFAPQDADYLVDVMGSFGKYMERHGQPPLLVREYLFDYMLRNKLLPDDDDYELENRPTCSLTKCAITVIEMVTGKN